MPACERESKECAEREQRDEVIGDSAEEQQQRSGEDRQHIDALRIRASRRPWS